MNFKNQRRRTPINVKHKGNSRFRRTAFQQLEAREFLSINVTQYRYDAASSGLNANETVLTPANVYSGNFGKQFTTAVDGQVLAQPVCMSAVNITTGSGGTHNVVFVATEHDSLYAMDAASGQVLWHDSFAVNGAGVTVTSVPSGDVNSGDISPEIGITGTPAIDATTGNLFVVAKTKAVYSASPSSPHYVDTLYKVNIANGTSTSEVIGDTTYSGGAYTYNSGPYTLGTGDGSVNFGGQNRVYFNALRQMFRPAVELVNGQVVLGSASHGDNGPYHGWMLTYNASTLTLTGVLNTTPNGGLGGIWQGGDAIVSDPQGYFYFQTGNGSFNQTASNFNAQNFPIDGDYGDSFVKVGVDTTHNSATNQNVNGWGLKVVDYFTPYNQSSLNGGDTDLGSGGPMVLPDSAGSTVHPHLLVGGGKQGSVYLIDRDSMGKFNASTDNVVQELANTVGGILSTPAYFNGQIYITSGYGGPIDAFSISNSQIAAVASTSDSFGNLDGSPVVSANGTANGIVWALERGSNELRAYSAANLSEIYNSATLANNVDGPGSVMKFTVPLVANGSVYVGTGNSLAMYGLNAPPTTPPAAPSNLAVTSVSGSEASISWSDNSNNESAFKIERSTDNFATYSQIGTVGVDQTTYVDSSVQPFTTYYYRVKATNVIGDSGYTNVATAETLGNPVLGGGDGLWGQYYSFSSNPDTPGSFNIASRLVQRVDPSINYDWSAAGPDPGVVGQSNYEVEWTGEVQAQYSEAYTFSTVSDDGVALYVSGQSVISNWTDHGSTTDTGSPITLQAGKTYPIVLYFYQRGGSAVIQLNWSSSHTTSGMIPQHQLFSGAAPATPTNLHVAAISGTQANLTWTTNATDEDGYEVDRMLGNSGTFSPVAYLPPASSQYLDTALIQGNTYTYEVRATNFMANSAWSNQAAITLEVPPDPISDAGPTVVTTNSIAMSWTNNDSNGTVIRVFRLVGPGGNPIFIASLPYTSGDPNEPSSYVDTGPGGRGLLPGTLYTYHVQCGNIAGFSAYSSFSVQTLSNAPSQLAAVPANNQVTLSWKAAFGSQTFNIYRGTSPGGENASPLANGVSGTTFVDTSVTDGTEYYYQASAVDLGGESARSAESTATPQTPTSMAMPPASVSTTSGDRTATLNWQAAPGASFYNIYRGASSGNEVLLASGISGLDYGDTGLSNGATYYYQVTSVNQLGESTRSSEAAATPQLTAPPSPINVIATPSDGQVSLSWSPASDALTYNIYRSTSPGNEVLYEQGITATSYTDSNTADGVAYYYQVSAGNGVGESNLSQEVSATPLPPLPAVPASFAATAQSASQIRLSWTEAPSTVTSFLVQRSNDGVNYLPLTTLDGAATSFVDASSLAPGTTNSYRIAASNLAGSSAWSAVATASPRLTVSLPWTDADIGGPPLTGSAYELNSRLYVNGTGNDIWNASDQFHFVYVPLTGNATIVTQVTSQGQTDPWAKAGVMFRNTLDAGSVFTMMVLTPGNGASFQWRLTANSSAGLGYATAGGIVPGWVKLVRSGSTFTGYVSTDGVNWGTAVGTTSLTMNSTLYVGLCDTSHNASLISAATFTSISINGSTAPAAPTGLTASPASGTSVSLTWSNHDSYSFANEIYRENPGSSTYSWVATVPANATTYLDTGLSLGGSYSYKILASNTAGNTASNVATVTTPMPPLAVSELQPNSIATNSAGLTWTLNSTNDTGVQIWRRANGTGIFSLVTTLPAASTSYTDNGLQAGTLYEYHVSAIDLAGASTAADTGLTTLPVAPVATAATQSGQVQVSWTASTGAVAYNVYRGLTAGGEGATPYATFNGATTFIDTGATSGQSYYYRVTAVDFSGASAPSAEVAAVIPLVIIGPPSALQATGSPITYTITYVDPFFANSTLSAGDVTLNKTGTANGQVAVTGVGMTRTVTISNITGNGSLGISIAANTASDALGNMVPAAGPSATFTINQNLTSIAVDPPSVSLTAGASQQSTAVANDQYGNPMGAQPSFIWSVAGGGSIDSGSGLYTPPYANGSAIVTATVGVLTGSTNVTFSGQAAWNSTTSNSWDSANWQDAASAAPIAAPGLRGVVGDTVLFGSVGGTPVTLDGASPSVAAISFNNSTGYTVSQGMGSGALHLDNYGGKSASITVSAGNQAISAPLVLDSNTVLAPQSGTSLTLSNTVSGLGSSLSVTGTGIVTLSGTGNSFGEGTIVIAGKLVVTDSGGLASGSSLAVGSIVGSAFGDVVAPAQAAAPAIQPAAPRASIAPLASIVASLQPVGKAAASVTVIPGIGPVNARDVVLQLSPGSRSVDLAWVALNNQVAGPRRRHHGSVPAALSVDQVLARFVH